MAAVWDKEMMLNVPQLSATEARAKASRLSKTGKGNISGLTYWTININIFRDQVGDAEWKQKIIPDRGNGRSVHKGVAG